MPANGYYCKAAMDSLLAAKQDKAATEDQVFTSSAVGIKLPEAGGSTILLTGMMDDGEASYDTQEVV